MKTVIQNPLKIIFILILVVGCLPPIYSQNNFGDEYILNHIVRITDHGFIAIEDILEYTNKGDSEVQLTDFELNYYGIPAEDFSSIQIEGPIDFLIEKVEMGNYTKIYFKPSNNYQVNKGTSISISTKFYISNNIHTIDGSLFSANIPINPSMNILLNEVRTSILMPPSSEVENLPVDFDIEDNEGFKRINRILENVTPDDYLTKILEYNTDPLTSLPILEFVNVNRIFLAKTDGSIIVREEIRVINRGELSDSRVKLNYLNPDISSIDIVPIDDPPLVNRYPINIFNNILDLQRGYGITLSKDEEFLFGIEYPLSNEYVNSMNGDVLYEIPLLSPIDGTIGTFTIDVIAESGIDVSNVERLEFEGFTPNQETLYTFNLNLRIAWDEERVVPIGTILFISTFAVLIFQRKGLGKERSMIDIPNIDEVISIFEEKFAVLEDIGKVFSGKKKVSAQKSSFAEFKRYFESLRGKTAGKLGETRARIVKISPNLNNKVLELSNSDKDFNRAALDIIGLYEKQFTGRMSQDTFKNLLNKYQSRLNKSRERIRETMDLIHNEVEK